MWTFPDKRHFKTCSIMLCIQIFCYKKKRWVSLWHQSSIKRPKWDQIKQCFTLFLKVSGLLINRKCICTCRYNEGLIKWLWHFICCSLTLHGVCNRYFTLSSSYLGFQTRSLSNASLTPRLTAQQAARSLLLKYDAIFSITSTGSCSNGKNSSSSIWKNSFRWKWSFYLKFVHTMNKF